MTDWSRSIEKSRSVTIVRFVDEDCAGHHKPCDGCPSFCELARDGEEGMVAEAYGVDHCAGEHWFHEETKWQCLIRYHMSSPYFEGSVVGFAQDRDEAIREAETELARMYFQQTKDDQCE